MLTSEIPGGSIRVSGKPGTGPREAGTQLAAPGGLSVPVGFSPRALVSGSRLVCAAAGWPLCSAAPFTQAGRRVICEFPSPDSKGHIPNKGGSEGGV